MILFCWKDENVYVYTLMNWKNQATYNKKEDENGIKTHKSHPHQI